MIPVMNSFFRNVAVMSTILLSSSLMAKADTAGLTSFSGGNPSTAGADQLYGWIFTANASINVTGLGVYDFEGTGNLSVSHDVGIFNATTEALVGSATVPAKAGATVINGFEYVSVSPFSLVQGQSYVIAMTMPQNNSDFQYIGVSSFTTASQITYNNSAFDQQSSLAFPNPGDDGAFAPGIFGPNFTFTTAVAPTPEPSSIALLGTGALTAAGFIRRRIRLS